VNNYLQTKPTGQTIHQDSIKKETCLQRICLISFACGAFCLIENLVYEAFDFIQCLIYSTDFFSFLVLGWRIRRRNVVYWNPNGRSSMISCGGEYAT